MESSRASRGMQQRWTAVLCAAARLSVWRLGKKMEKTHGFVFLVKVEVIPSGIFPFPIHQTGVGLKLVGIDMCCFQEFEI